MSAPAIVRPETLSAATVHTDIDVSGLCRISARGSANRMSTWATRRRDDSSSMTVRFLTVFRY